MDAELNAAEKIELNKQYNDSLKKFDLATCEAVAVSQSIGVQMAEPHLGHSTYVFARLCNHAIAIISAVPAQDGCEQILNNGILGLRLVIAEQLLKGISYFYTS